MKKLVLFVFVLSFSVGHAYAQVCNHWWGGISNYSTKLESIGAEGKIYNKAKRTNGETYFKGESVKLYSETELENIDELIVGKFNVHFSKLGDEANISLIPTGLNGSYSTKGIKLEGDSFFMNTYKNADGKDELFVVGVSIEEKLGYKAGDGYKIARYQFLILSENKAQKIIDGRSFSNENQPVMGARDFHLGQISPKIEVGGNAVLFQYSGGRGEYENSRGGVVKEILPQFLLLE